MSFALTHKSSNRSRSCVENINLMFINHFPKTRNGRIVRHTFKHQSSRCIRQRTVNNIAVACNPTDVGCAPVHIGVGVEIEHVLVCVRHMGEVTTRGVHDSLRFTGGAARVTHRGRGPLVYLRPVEVVGLGGQQRARRPRPHHVRLAPDLVRPIGDAPVGRAVHLDVVVRRRRGDLAVPALPR